MKIQEFIKDRNINYSTVFQYIKRNEKLFSGHIGSSKKIELDDIAIEILDKKYPLPNPVQIIEDTAAKEELAEVKSQLIQTQQMVISLQQKLVEAAPKIAFIEQTEKTLELTTQELFDSKEENTTLKNENIQIKDELAKLQTELENEKSKSWWDKLRGK